MDDRTPLTVAISTDQDKSYPNRRNIATGKDSFAYPYVIQAKDGKIHLVYTSEVRSVINHAVFEEAAILKKVVRCGVPHSPKTNVPNFWNS